MTKIADPPPNCVRCEHEFNKRVDVGPQEDGVVLEHYEVDVGQPCWVVRLEFGFDADEKPTVHASLLT